MEEKTETFTQTLFLKVYNVSCITLQNLEGPSKKYVSISFKGLENQGSNFGST